MVKNDETWEKIINYHKEGYTNAEIGRMMGVSRQRIGAVVNVYKGNQKKMLPGKLIATDYQLSKLNEIVFVNIKAYLIENNIAFVDFCKMVAESEDSYYYYREKKFLTGQSENTSLRMIRNILKITGMTFEEAFEKEGEADEVDSIV